MDIRVERCCARLPSPAPSSRSAPRLLIATGDSGHGMTHGTIAGLLLTDLIRVRPNEWAWLYDLTGGD